MAQVWACTAEELACSGAISDAHVHFMEGMGVCAVVYVHTCIPGVAMVTEREGSRKTRPPAASFVKLRWNPAAIYYFAEAHS